MFALQAQGGLSRGEMAPQPLCSPEIWSNLLNLTNSNYEYTKPVAYPE